MEMKPYLLVVTGRPGAGKTSFAKALGNEMWMPVISRDQIKEGYVHTQNKSHSQLPVETNGIVNEIFFGTIMKLIEGGVSVIVEAAFQHKLWSAMLKDFTDKVNLRVFICTVEDNVAHERFLNRKSENKEREYFHGDNIAGVSTYEAPRLDVPTFFVDTTDGYVPSVKDLVKLKNLR